MGRNGGGWTVSHAYRSRKSRRIGSRFEQFGEELIPSLTRSWLRCYLGLYIMVEEAYASATKVSSPMVVLFKDPQSTWKSSSRGNEPRTYQRVVVSRIQKPNPSIPMPIISQAIIDSWRKGHPISPPHPQKGQNHHEINPAIKIQFGMLSTIIRKEKWIIYQ